MTHHHCLRHHCAIEDGDSVVLTGGIHSYSTVTRVNVHGQTTSLPSLINGRWTHACGKFTTTDLETVSL